MGRQISLVATLDDERVFLDFLRSTAALRIFESFAPTAPELWVETSCPISKATSVAGFGTPRSRGNQPTRRSVPVRTIQLASVGPTFRTRAPLPSSSSAEVPQTVRGVCTGRETLLRQLASGSALVPSPSGLMRLRLGAQVRSKAKATR
jgi:hypothetical protein